MISYIPLPHASRQTATTLTSCLSRAAASTDTSPSKCGASRGRQACASASFLTHSTMYAARMVQVAPARIHRPRGHSRFCRKRTTRADPAVEERPCSSSRMLACLQAHGRVTLFRPLCSLQRAFLAFFFSPPPSLACFSAFSSTSTSQFSFSSPFFPLYPYFGTQSPLASS